MRLRSLVLSGISACFRRSVGQSRFVRHPLSAQSVGRFDTALPSRRSRADRSLQRSMPLGDWERLEDRLLLASFSVPFAARDILAAQAVDWHDQLSTLNAGNPQDLFTFTLPQAAGVFVDIDAQDIGLSTVDTIVHLFRGSTQIAMNDDGYDFEGIDPVRGISRDASLYADLAAGSYEVRVTRFGSTSGAYRLRMLFDTNYAAAVPVFNSLPGAADTVFLDFDGHAATDAWGTYNAARFNFGGGPANTWSPGERLAIRNVWATVAEDFSPFAINVSTVQPASFADGVGFRMAITESPPSIVDAGDAIGIAFSNSYASGGLDDQTAWVFANDIGDFNAGATEGWSGRIVAGGIEVGNTTSHEFGHALGLDHWASSAGEANNASVFPNAIMATPDTGLSRELWQVGSRNEEGRAQDDVAVIAGAANTFGYRADDHGDSRAAASALVAAGSRYSAAGVIQRLTDLDYFRFDASGSTTIAVDVQESFNNLDVRIRLLNAAGAVLATHDPADSFDAAITTTLASGTYFLEIASNGDVGEIGQYAVRIDNPGLNNAPPVARNDALVTNEDAAVSGNVITANNGSGADSDPDSDPLTLAAINGAAVTSGQVVVLPSGALLTVQASGAVVYNPNGRFESLALGATATDTFTYNIRDAVGNTASATVSVTIQGRNDVPIATNNAYVVSKETSVSGNLLTQDTGAGVDRDPDGQPLSLTRINGAIVTNGQTLTLPSGARLIIGSNGNFSYDPLGQFNHLTTGQSATDSFTYQIVDPHGAAASATATITVLGQQSQVNINGSTATAIGTDGDDVIVFDAAARTIVINGRTTNLPGSVGTIALDARLGRDHLTLLGTTGVDRVVLRPGSALFDFNPALAGFEFSAVSVETVVADGRGGTSDSAFLDDSPGNDLFTARPLDASLAGDGFSHRAINFEIVTGRAINGGVDDRALLVDSVGADTFAAGPTQANLSGDGFVLSAAGFDRVVGSSTGHPGDRALLRGSTGTDEFLAAHDGSQLSGPQYLLVARGFAAVSATAFAGGNDVARFADTAGDDTFVSRAAFSFLRGSGLFLSATDFPSVVARAMLGGFDRAFLIDSPADDSFTGDSATARIVGGGSTREATGFDIASGLAVGGGTDTATLTDTPGADTASLSRGLATFSSPTGLYLTADGFESITVRSISGGADRALLFDTAGDDTLAVSPAAARLSGPGYDATAAGFDMTLTRAGVGLDRVDFTDSPGDDAFVADRQLAALSGSGFSHQAAGFDIVSVVASTGQDTARLTDSTLNDLFTSREFTGILTSPGFELTVTRFDVVNLFGTQGGINRLDRSPIVPYTLNLFGSWVS